MKIDHNENKNNTNMASKKTDILVNLPPELTILILSFLSARDLLSVSSVSHGWRQKIDYDRLWKDRLNTLGIKPKSFKEQYFSMESIFQNCVSKIFNVIFDSIAFLRFSRLDAGGLETTIDNGNTPDDSSAGLPSSPGTGGLGTATDNSTIVSNNNSTLLFNALDLGLSTGISNANIPHTLANAPNLFSAFANNIQVGIDTTNLVDNAFSDLLNEIASQHQKALKAGISTYEIFNSVLRKINSEKPKLSWEFANTTILYYLLYISDITSPPNIELKGLNDPRIIYLRISNRDYYDIVSLIKILICDDSIDLNKNFGYAKTINTLDFMAYKKPFFSRPSPLIISLLIEAGTNFDITVTNGFFDNIPFTDMLIRCELEFHTLSQSDSYNNFNPQLINYIEEYRKFIGKDNLISSAQKPLSNEFLDMAKTIFHYGGTFSTFEGLKASPIFSDEAPTLMGYDYDQTERLLHAACDQLEELKTELKLNTYLCQC